MGHWASFDEFMAFNIQVERLLWHVAPAFPGMATSIRRPLVARPVGSRLQSRTHDQPWLLRNAYRVRNPAGNRYNVLGFRAARTFTP